MYLDLAEAMNRAAVDETVTCLVLTGKGDYFSSGADLTDDSWSPDSDHKMEASPAAIFMKVGVCFWLRYMNPAAPHPLPLSF